MRRSLGLLALLLLPGCTTLDELKGYVEIKGFVERSGWYPYQRGMTVQDLLEAAGGYDTCNDCAIWDSLDGHEAHLREKGGLSERYIDSELEYLRNYERINGNYAIPPTITRNGEELPGMTGEWRAYKLRPKDQLQFRHFGI